MYHFIHTYIFIYVLSEYLSLPLIDTVIESRNENKNQGRMFKND